MNGYKLEMVNPIAPQEMENKKKNNEFTLTLNVNGLGASVS